MKGAIIAFTDRGEATGRRLAESFGNLTLERCPAEGLREWTRRHFQTGSVLVFVGAAGIAVRAIAPLLRRKDVDPAVLVIDEEGRYVIPLLSGHLGGANELAWEMAGVLGATAVITTATDLRGVFAVDLWARQQNLAVENPEAIRQVSSRLLRGDPVAVRSAVEIEGSLPPGLHMAAPAEEALLSIGLSGPGLRLWPRDRVLGIGTRKGIPEEAVMAALERLLAETGMSPFRIAAVATLDLKAEEPAILSLCRRLSCPLRTFSSAELSALPGHFTSSDFVREVTGVDNVCERAAVLAGGGELIVSKRAGGGVTLAVAGRPQPLCWDWRESNGRTDHRGPGTGRAGGHDSGGQGRP